MTKTNTYTIFAVFIAMASLTAYSFSGATWIAPTGTPPNNNTEAPINIGVQTQVKAGNVGANILAASSSVWSDLYCDGKGKNCTPAVSDRIFIKCSNDDSSDPNNIPCYEAGNITTDSNYRVISCLASGFVTTGQNLYYQRGNSMDPGFKGGYWKYFNRYGNWHNCDDNSVVVANLNL